MSAMIQNPSDVDCSKLEFQPVKVLDNGGKSVNIRYAGRDLKIETPSLNVPYGVNVFDKNGPPKFSVDLSFRGADEDEKIKALQDFFEAFDERMIDAGVENAQKWWKMTNPNREVIKAFYTPVIKVSKDAQGNPKPYPPTFKLALRKKRDQSATSDLASCFEADFYNGASKDAKGQISAFDKDTPMDQILCKRSQASAIAQCTGVWFAGGKFGTTWKVFQMRVDSQPEQIRGPAFRSEAPDIRAFVAKNVVAKAAAVVADEVEEDEEEEAEPEPEPKPVPKKAVAVVTAFEEDEEVSEPVPVPKKVVKKVVKKTA